ncbi:hypothetical protein BCR36DRAFT_374241 [Piromyces finnis]|uniref:Uncharacterized protein n=1 Tax=Piromyces finnis TaxID=1754191 RepID=A0A1Y1UYG1_9FUNG|nr:hypothetical protein BCR36DRAFT_374241 [Piromyces finnis]|eukprot:ORX42839.1 hypothetical protein BCR36DRAFT_374241 [Piromyces finnis]
MDNLISQYLLMKQINQKVILLLDNIIIMMTFSYISRVQLKRQPYYSTSINNYKFATYFTLSSFSIYTTLLALFNFNNFQFIADSSPFIILILFIGSYKYNNYYHKKMLHRIYKKYQEKKIVNDLKQSIDNNPENVEMKNIYNSVERITKEVYVKKEIKVFCNYYECEIASRFLRYKYKL